jgi:hypothetical protein
MVADAVDVLDAAEKIGSGPADPATKRNSQSTLMAEGHASFVAPFVHPQK